MFNLEKLHAIFKEYPYIACAYLFGSFASGKTGPMSDMDIAILLKAPYCENCSKSKRYAK